MHCYRLIDCLMFFLLLGQCVFMQSVQAQMYQWIDPETGTTQLSGKPPPWYRGAEGGPRIFVFNRGKVVDDTGIQISDDQGIKLRLKAFMSAEKDRLAAREKLDKVAKLKMALQKNANEAARAESEDAVAEKEFRDATAGTPVEKELDEDSVAKMKALIAE